jgi:hypothetical protein
LKLSIAKYDQEGRSNYGSCPKYRVNDKFSIYLVADYTNTKQMTWLLVLKLDIIIGKEREKYYK